jgi:phage terminase large subunit
MAEQAPKVRVQFPEPFRDIFTPSRYKSYWGGRGSGKSTSVATALCIIGSMKPKRILCCREIQKSIADSVKKLLDDRIAALGLSGLYRSTQTSITTPAGTEFIFAGLRTNADSIKSMEGIDIAWVEEANTVSQRSMDLLIPTVRKPGSELFFTWNPRDAKDPVDVMFRGGEPPPNSIVRKVNFTDNPWFPDVLREDMEWDKRRDPDKYAHIWLGEYRRNASARVFKNWRIDALDVGEDWRPYFGADWGFGDPTVLVKSYLLDEKTLYIEDEAYKVNCEIDDIPALFAGDDMRDPPRWSNPRRHPGISGAAEWPITADSARPETISYMAKRGFNIHHSRKGAGSVEDGIEFLKSCDIIVHPKCKHTIDELTMYCYKTDPLTNEVLPVLADKNNHIIDALRYGLEGTRHAKRRIAFA